MHSNCIWFEHTIAHASHRANVVPNVRLIFEVAITFINNKKYMKLRYLIITFGVIIEIKKIFTDRKHFQIN